VIQNSYYKDVEINTPEICCEMLRALGCKAYIATTHMLATTNKDDFTARMMEAVNGMLLDMLAAVARKDYEDRRRRQAQGQAKAKAEGRYKGRPEDVKRNGAIATMLAGGQSWSTIQAATGCSRATIAKVAKRLTTAKAA
jgi:DNA invertase Pin-like site-specific DNA recombinase